MSINETVVKNKYGFEEGALPTTANINALANAQTSKAVQEIQAALTIASIIS